MAGIPLADRWHANVDKNGPIPAHAPHLGPCWCWLRKPDAKGYGSIKDGKLRRKAHRVGYELLVGPIPDGLDLDHLCRNTMCVNPDHLEPVTHRINVLRGEANAAKNARKTHCINGHPLDGPDADLLSDPRLGRRICRICRNAGARERFRRKRESAGNT